MSNLFDFGGFLAWLHQGDEFGYLSLFCGLSLLLGLPHGALDLWIVKNTYSQKPKHIAFFTMTYLMLTGFVLLGLYVFPVWFFVFFLLYSALHFGLDYLDRQSDCGRLVGYGWAMLAGCCLVCGPSLRFHGTIVPLFLPMLGHLYAENMVFAMQTLGLFCMVLQLLLFAKAPYQDKFELAGMILLSLIVHPLIYLTIFFIGFHSRKHYQTLYRALHFSSLKVFLKALVPMTLLSLVLAAGIGLLFFYGEVWRQQLFATIIYLLAALSLPHIIMVELLQNHTDRRDF